MDKELLDIYNAIQNVKEKDYPMFPRCDKSGMVTPEEYRAWRRVFLVKLQSDGRMNVVLADNFVPPHLVCPVPQANDPVYGATSSYSIRLKG